MESEKVTFRAMRAADGEAVVEMMREFYTSAAVATNGSEKIFAANVENCTGGSDFVDGFIFETGGRIVGYGIVAKSYSTEFGGECVWIEDIFVEAGSRGRGIGSEFIRYVEEKYSGKILRLEAEGDNSAALALYKKFGFKELPYTELVMTREG